METIKNEGEASDGFAKKSSYVCYCDSCERSRTFRARMAENTASTQAQGDEVSLAEIDGALKEVGL